MSRRRAGPGRRSPAPPGRAPPGPAPASPRRGRGRRRLAGAGGAGLGSVAGRAASPPRSSSTWRASSPSSLGALLVHREHVGRRVGLAVSGHDRGRGWVVLGSRGGRGGAELWGLAAVTLATRGWAIDNTLARSAGRTSIQPPWWPPREGWAPRSSAWPRALRRRAPARGRAGRSGSSGWGALGWGLSLQALPAGPAHGSARARTASVYAVAPFAGAVCGRPRRVSPSAARRAWAGGALLAVGRAPAPERAPRAPPRATRPSSTSTPTATTTGLPRPRTATRRRRAEHSHAHTARGRRATPTRTRRICTTEHVH